MNKLEMEKVVPLLKLAIEEDMGQGDMTSDLFFGSNVIDKADIISREEIIVCGIPIARMILRMYDKRLKLDAYVKDGQQAYVGCHLATIRGPLGPMLTAERVVLNFMQRLCGIATTTKKYVRAVLGTNARIYDTRKTLPGWRLLEKYAVRCGGGYNHRLGLYDGILIKDNHIAQLGRNFKPKLKKIIEKAQNKTRQICCRRG